MNEHEKINYVEFPSKDIQATKEFFIQVFGWSLQDFGPEYSAFSNQGIDGGFFKSELSASTANGGSSYSVLQSRTWRQPKPKVISS